MGLHACLPVPTAVASSACPCAPPPFLYNVECLEMGLDSPLADPSKDRRFTVSIIVFAVYFAARFRHVFSISSGAASSMGVCGMLFWQTNECPFCDTYCVLCYLEQ